MASATHWRGKVSVLTGTPTTHVPSPTTFSCVTSISLRWVSEWLPRVTPLAGSALRLAAVKLYFFESQAFLGPRRDLGDGSYFPGALERKDDRSVPEPQAQTDPS